MNIRHDNYIVWTGTYWPITSSKWVYKQFKRVSIEDSDSKTDQSHVRRYSTIETVSVDLKSRNVKLRGEDRIIEDLMETENRSCPSAKGISVFQCSITESFESMKHKSNALLDVDLLGVILDIRVTIDFQASSHTTCWIRECKKFG